MLLRRFLTIFLLAFLGLMLDSTLVAMQSPENKGSEESWDTSDNSKGSSVTSESWDTSESAEEPAGKGFCLEEDSYDPSDSEASEDDHIISVPKKLLGSNKGSDDFLMHEATKGLRNLTLHSQQLNTKIPRIQQKSLVQIADAIVAANFSLETIGQFQVCLSELKNCVCSLRFQLQDGDVNKLCAVGNHVKNLIIDLKKRAIKTTDKNILFSCQDQVIVNDMSSLLVVFNAILKICGLSQYTFEIIKNPIFIDDNHIMFPGKNAEGTIGGGHFHCPDSDDLGFNSLEKNGSCELGYWTVCSEGKKIDKISTLFAKEFEEKIFGFVLEDESLNKNDLYKFGKEIPDSVYSYVDEKSGNQLYFKIIYDQKSECVIVKTAYPLFVHEKIVFSYLDEDFKQFGDACRFHAFEVSEDKKISKSICWGYFCGIFPKCSDFSKKVNPAFFIILPENSFDSSVQKLYSQIPRSDRRLRIMDFKTGKLDSSCCLLQFDRGGQTYMYVKVHYPEVMLTPEYEKSKMSKALKKISKEFLSHFLLLQNMPSLNKQEYDSLKRTFIKVMQDLFNHYRREPLGTDVFSLTSKQA